LLVEIGEVLVAFLETSGAVSAVPEAFELGAEGVDALSVVFLFAVDAVAEEAKASLGGELEHIE